MKEKLLVYLKRISLVLISLSIFIAIIFFIFIAPHRTLPILMYHSITDVEDKNILTLPRDIFDRQMQYLSKHKFYVASLEEAAQMMQRESFPNNWLAITFDDGFRDFYSLAYLTLKRFNFKSTVFVTVNSLKESERSLTWKQVENLAKEPMVDIGSHALSHRMLPLLSQEQKKEEIFLSKRMLERRLDRPVISFCYPYGALDDSVKEMVRQADYKLAVATAYQRGEFRDNDMYVLRRVFVSKISRYPLVFRFMLSGYYVPTREFFLRLLNIKTPRDLYAAKSAKLNSLIEK